jgi:hypothetical protein
MRFWGLPGAPVRVVFEKSAAEEDMRAARKPKPVRDTTNDARLAEMKRRFNEKVRQR